ncbi:MAG: hypothetical protein GX946_00710 [Oligosphaeraceae bacterium]|nr:hypothetical protein [Oligosphaeraceae bacterium]
MAQKTSREVIRFNGIFTPELRRRLQVKRLELGLAYQRLGALLQVNWSTIRKWECGQTKCCTLNMRKRVEDFLNGKYDEILIKEMQDPLTGSYPIRPPCQVISCMERFSNAYQLLKPMPDLRTKLVKKLEQVTNQSMEQLLQGNYAPKSKRRL